MTETTAGPTHEPAARGRATAPRRSGALVLVAAVITVVLWASAFIGIRGAGPHFDPGALALLRMAVGTVALTVIALRRGVRLPPRRHWLLVAVWGVGWFCVYNLALNAAEHTLDAGTAAMVVNLAPLMVVVFSGLFLREGFPKPLLIGAPIAFAGVVLIGVNSSTKSGALNIAGLLLALLAAVMYAGCTLLQKHLLSSGADATTLTWLGAAAGTVALLPWTGSLVGALQTAPLDATLWVVYLGVFPTAIAFTTWAYVLQRSTAGQTSATTYVVPAIAILLSWLILGEVPTPLMFVGGALCLLGVLVTRLRRRAVAAAPATPAAPATEADPASGPGPTR
ncbi:Permease of the drug/metabolite transporter (DMT) superfamily [Microbacterium azadirachtae]|uniref:Permease of the drug/metabolite transporter (DMT) superfamily n=1 Tax=Microbacterium azadirachtae TaxID=582680 RepID=A0A1I6HJN2_9MICO|nr:EamA family transporter [Microbacterium azadirachtae]SFR54673.1 Permease of the drug/metabolite transporter (DMT) superfamily [Microbacterium azadirachtae]